MPSDNLSVRLNRAFLRDLNILRNKGAPTESEKGDLNHPTTYMSAQSRDSLDAAKDNFENDARRITSLTVSLSDGEPTYFIKNLSDEHIAAFIQSNKERILNYRDSICALSKLDSAEFERLKNTDIQQYPNQHTLLQKIKALSLTDYKQALFSSSDLQGLESILSNDVLMDKIVRESVASQSSDEEIAKILIENDDFIKFSTSTAPSIYGRNTDAIELIKNPVLQEYFVRYFHQGGFKDDSGVVLNLVNNTNGNMLSIPAMGSDGKGVFGRYAYLDCSKTNAFEYRQIEFFDKIIDLQTESENGDGPKQVSCKFSVEALTRVSVGDYQGDRPSVELVDYIIRFATQEDKNNFYSLYLQPEPLSALNFVDSIKNAINSLVSSLYHYFIRLFGGRPLLNTNIHEITQAYLADNAVSTDFNDALARHKYKKDCLSAGISRDNIIIQPDQDREKIQSIKQQVENGELTLNDVFNPLPTREADSTVAMGPRVSLSFTPKPSGTILAVDDGKSLVRSAKPSITNPYNQPITTDMCEKINHNLSTFLVAAGLLVASCLTYALSGPPLFRYPVIGETFAAAARFLSAIKKKP
ncbi:hypothetical protein EBQ91_06490 [bacterium]|nr:hypothetical protein [bacterium]